MTEVMVRVLGGSCNLNKALRLDVRRKYSFDCTNNELSLRHYNYYNYNNIWKKTN